MPVTQEFTSVHLAVVNVPAELAAIFRDCFAELKVTVQPALLGAHESINLQRFDACVLTLADAEAAKTLSAIRRSEVNRHCVVYAIGTVERAVKLSRYGINALIEQPTAAAVSAAVRRTYLLLAHRLRRHVRIPVVTAVGVRIGDGRLMGISNDISAGGMNLAVKLEERVGRHVSVTFRLPQTPLFQLEGMLCWKTDVHCGIAFFNSTKQAQLTKWVDDYLLIPERLPTVHP